MSNVNGEFSEGFPTAPERIIDGFPPEDAPVGQKYRWNQRIISLDEDGMVVEHAEIESTRGHEGTMVTTSSQGAEVDHMGEFTISGKGQLGLMIGHHLGMRPEVAVDAYQAPVHPMYYDPIDPREPNYGYDPRAVYAGTRPAAIEGRRGRYVEDDEYDDEDDYDELPERKPGTRVKKRVVLLGAVAALVAVGIPFYQIKVNNAGTTDAEDCKKTAAVGIFNLPTCGVDEFASLVTFNLLNLEQK